MISLLKIILLIVWFFMIYMVVATSLESSLFKEWNHLGAIPWMRATLWDFYANILVIYLFVLYKEKSTWIKLLWSILFFCLGSIASIGYLLILLFKLKSDEGIDKILQPKS